MKYLIPLVFIGLIGAGVYFVNKTTPLDDEGQTNQSELKSTDKPKASNESHGHDHDHEHHHNDKHDHIKEGFQNDSSAQDELKSEYKRESDYTPSEDEMTEYFNDEEMIEDEYKEEVSDDDFNEFLSAAQEEIMDDPEIAEAIIGEMNKIFKVQPDHQQKIIRFYEECAGNAKLPDHIRNLCDKERDSTGN